MLLSSRLCLAAAAVLLCTAATSAAQGVKLEFVNGRVNLSAQQVPVRAILAEWARLGGTTIQNGDRVQGPALTLELTGVPERQALDVILREVPGYMLAARPEGSRGASAFDRIMIMPTTTVPRPTPAATFSSAPPPFASPADQSDVEDAAARARDLAAEALRRRTEEQNRAGIVNPAVTARPGVPPPFGDTDPAPRPATPPPAPLPGNPFAPTPGSSMPGTIAPVPQQQQPNTGARPVQ
jgi:hypothetical protein